MEMLSIRDKNLYKGGNVYFNTFFYPMIEEGARDKKFEKAKRVVKRKNVTLRYNAL
jgi:hypothetical protein